LAYRGSASDELAGVPASSWLRWAREKYRRDGRSILARSRPHFAGHSEVYTRRGDQKKEAPPSSVASVVQSEEVWTPNEFERRDYPRDQSP
jgi:hypothetical protein